MNTLPKDIPFHMHMHHLNMIIFGSVCLIVLLFHILRWGFIAKALSDATGPSAFRLLGYYVIMTICLCEVFTTMQTSKFDTTHLLYLLFGAGVLLGFIKVVDIVSIYKGNAVQPKTDVDPVKTAPNE